MSIENSSPFDFWESELSDLDLPEIPKDPLDDIVERSMNPIDCAIGIHNYASVSSEEAQSLLIRRGISKLSYRYYGPYLGKKTYIATDGAFGIPETNQLLRKREITRASQYVGEVLAMGKLATFLTAQYKNETTGESRTCISLRLLEPYLLNNDGNVNTERELPDYLMVPIADLLDYRFEPND